MSQGEPCPTHLHTADSAKHQDGSIQHPQRPLDLDGEIHVSGCIDDVDRITLLVPLLPNFLVLAPRGLLTGRDGGCPIAKRSGGLDGDPLFTLELHGIHLGTDGVSASDFVDVTDPAGVEEDSFGQGRFSRVDVCRTARRGGNRPDQYYTDVDGMSTGAHIPMFLCLLNLLISLAVISGKIRSGHLGGSASSSASFTAAADEACLLPVTPDEFPKLERFVGREAGAMEVARNSREEAAGVLLGTLEASPVVRRANRRAVTDMTGSFYLFCFAVRYTSYTGRVGSTDESCARRCRDELDFIFQRSPTLRLFASENSRCRHQSKLPVAIQGVKR